MTKVSRSAYQKLKEENKRLMADLKLICHTDVRDNSDWECQGKWFEYFKKEAEFNAMTKEVAVAYLKEHPEYDITHPGFDINKLPK